MEPSGTSAGNNYLLVINGKPEGPFSIAQLSEFKIKPSDFVRTAGMSDYKEAHEVAELRALFGFKNESVIPQYFGSFDQRLTASVLDWLFVSFACMLLGLLVVVFMNDRSVGTTIALSLLAIVPIVKFVYHIIMESSAAQATYGKQLLRIKVCDLEGERITAAHAIGRNMAKIVSVCSFFIGYLFSFFNKKQQCLHDMIAGTLVMKDRLF